MLRILALSCALLGALAAPAGAAVVTFEPENGGELGTYVLTADAGGGDLILSGIVRTIDDMQFNTIQFNYDGGSIDYSAIEPGWCEVPEGDSRLYCGVAEGDSFRYEGTDAVDELSLGVGDRLYPWMKVTFNGRGGKDVAKDDSASEGVNTALRTYDMGEGNDTVWSYAGNDVLLGGGGNDTLEATAGNQVLRGGAGDDILRGDTYAEEFGADVIDGGEGFDEGDHWYQPSASTPGAVSITQDGAANDGRAGENDNVTSIEKIWTGAPGTFQGTEGADNFRLYANSSTTATLLGGDDTFDGGTNTETVDGGAGNDTLQGGFGHDTITGGPGQDVINGDGGSYCGIYSCSVPFGNDVIHARDGEADTIECGVGEDTVTADGIDTVASSCEKVDRGAPTGTTPGGTTPGGTTPGGTTPGAATPGGTPAEIAAGFAFKLLSKLSIKALLKSGGSFEVACGTACVIKAQLLYKGKAVGSGKKTLLAAGKAKVPVKVAKKHRRKLKRLRKGKFVLKVTITDASGKSSTFTKTLVFKK